MVAFATKIPRISSPGFGLGDHSDCFHVKHLLQGDPGVGLLLPILILLQVSAWRQQ